MFQNNGNLKSNIFFLLLFLPIASFSDGGMSRQCTSYKLYDVQPTLVRKYRLVIKSLKINGLLIPDYTSIKEIKGINNNNIPRSDMDTVTIHKMEISQDNKSIVSVSCLGLGGEYFSFEKK